MCLNLTCAIFYRPPYTDTWVTTTALLSVTWHTNWMERRKQCTSHKWQRGSSVVVLIPNMSQSLPDTRKQVLSGTRSTAGCCHLSNLMTWWLTYLELVPPVPLGTSGSSLAPFWMVSCNIFNLLPLEVDHLQILLESSAPRLLGESCFTSAIRWSPAYCHFRRSMIW